MPTNQPLFRHSTHYSTWSPCLFLLLNKLISKIYGPLHDWFRPWVLNWLTAYDERVWARAPDSFHLFINFKLFGFDPDYVDAYFAASLHYVQSPQLLICRRWRSPSELWKPTSLSPPRKARSVRPSCQIPSWLHFLRPEGVFSYISKCVASQFWQLHSSSVVDILTLLSQEIDDIEDVGWPILEHLVCYTFQSYCMDSLISISYIFMYILILMCTCLIYWNYFLKFIYYFYFLIVSDRILWIVCKNSEWNYLHVVFPIPGFLMHRHTSPVSSMHLYLAHSYNISASVFASVPRPLKNMFHAISHRVKVGHLMTTYSEWLTGHFFAWQVMPSSSIRSDG